jgi:NodT family efflux transporter outer membrane factor (OMF) lipoprotein
MFTRSFTATLAAFVTLLVGCATGPKYSPPAQPTLQSYTGTAPNSAEVPAAGRSDASPGSRQTIVLGLAPRDKWWTQLQSPELDQVVDLALQNNLSLEVARANLAQAQEGVNAARGARSIQVDAAAGVERLKYGASFLGPEAETFPTFSAYTLGPTVSYDLDIFGATRHRIGMAGASADYEHEQLRAARLRVVGDSVTQALHIASIRAQIAVVQEVLSADEKTLDLVRAARRVGVVSDIDVLQATSQRDQDRTLLPPLHQDLDVAKDALAVLIGKAPSEWTAPDFALDQFVLPHELNLVVPSELVRSRPDIRAAESRLHEASEEVGVATADLYPRITLSSGWAEEGLLSGGTATAWSLVGGITAPIFHGGTLTARKRAAQDDYHAAFARYQLVVLQSFAQVADTLHALDHDADGLETQQQALASADSSLGLTRQGYRVGNADILQILTAQRLYELAELGVVNARTRKLTDTVSLFLASGTGNVMPGSAHR